MAPDVVAETFLVAWRRLDDVPAAALPWLLRVARNVIGDVYRADARRAALDAEMRAWVDGLGRDEDAAEHAVERIAVLRALASLSAGDREALTLVAWHGLSAAEGARVTGCSKATFFVRLHRARRRLERAMAAVDADATTGTPAARLVPRGESL